MNNEVMGNGVEIRSALLTELHHEVSVAARLNGTVDLRLTKIASALNVDISDLCATDNTGDYLRLADIRYEYFDEIEDNDLEDTFDLTFKDGYASILVDQHYILREVTIILGAEACYYELTEDGTLVPREFDYLCEAIAHVS